MVSDDVGARLGFLGGGIGEAHALDDLDAVEVLVGSVSKQTCLWWLREIYVRCGIGEEVGLDHVDDWVRPRRKTSHGVSSLRGG